MARKPKSQDPWVSNPDLIRRFLDTRPQYEELCREVEYILRKRIQEVGIEVSTVTCRAKTLSSFLEKMDRKQYESPLGEATDLAGARVVCLYREDIAAIEEIVKDEFEVLERVDKLAQKGSDEFGYGALHFIVRLGEKSSGARYDDLKGLVCEVQVRTVLQDAWAIIDHHLVYKSESAVPSAIQRKLNSLAGLFETADDQFGQIRQQRLDYVEGLKESTGDPDEFLATELNLDSLREYLLWRFPDRPIAASDYQELFILDRLHKAGYSTLSDLQRVLDKEAIELALGVADKFPYVMRVDGMVPSALILLYAVCIVDQAISKSIPWTDKERKTIQAHAKHGQASAQ